MGNRKINRKLPIDNPQHIKEINLPFVGHGRIASINDIAFTSLPLKNSRVECPNMKKKQPSPINKNVVTTRAPKVVFNFRIGNRLQHSESNAEAAEFLGWHRPSSRPSGHPIYIADRSDKQRPPGTERRTSSNQTHGDNTANWSSDSPESCSPT